MKAKLIKDNNLYGLKDGDKIIGTSDDELNSLLNYPFRLSIKNCEAIEHGYDLEELAEETYPIFNLGLNATTAIHTLHQESFKEGFQKALELIETEIKQLREFARDCAENWDCDDDSHRYNTPCRCCEAETLKQQTEWDVEMEMEPRFYDDSLGGFSTSYKEGMPIEQPKLDAEGCLILKLKSE